MSSFTCADCPLKPCKDVRSDQYPLSCPTMEIDNYVFEDLYDKDDIKIAHFAAITEGDGYCKLTRVEETMDFAFRMNYKKIGLGFCVGLSKEASILVEILRANGFDVEAASCKCGSISKEFINVNKEHWVDSNCENEIMCNPVCQAHFLDSKRTDLNVIIGLCVGHDTLFIKHSNAPVTVLAAKDRVTGNNPIQPLYVADTQYAKLFTYISRTFKQNNK